MFLKLSSILSLPLVRITQAESKDDVSVAEYFSSDLVKYVRSVLEIVPMTVFDILHSITALQTQQLKELPTKLEKKYLSDYAQLGLRYSLAKQTHKVSVFTMGVLNMKTTLLGIIKLDPKQTLEDGIRKQLVRNISVAMHELLDFKTGKVDEFETRLSQLGSRLDGFRQAFEYIQDYINIYGLKIWYAYQKTCIFACTFMHIYSYAFFPFPLGLIDGWF
jgi:WASH complex subunit strumpellin